MAKILCVDDDSMITAGVKEYLEALGHHVEPCFSGEDAWQLLKVSEFDLIILDWTLPGISGLEVCQLFRECGGKTWIIFLTGKGEISEKEMAFDAGGDDYITKPFDIRELAARARGALRRATAAYTSELKVGNMQLNAEALQVNYGEHKVSLTPRECCILEYLMRRPGAVCSSQKILRAVWPSESSASEGTVRTIIRNLRTKLDSIGLEDAIYTTPKSGYSVGKEMPWKKVQIVP